MKCVLIVVLAAAIGAQAEYEPICPLIYSPICGSDGKDYGNDCEFNFAQQKDHTLTIKFRGTCEYTTWDEVVCHDYKHPVEICGSDGTRYKNQCYFDFAVKRNPSLTKRHLSECPKKEDNRARRHTSVCGTDGKIYDHATFHAQQSVRPQLGEWPLQFCKTSGGPPGPSPIPETPTVCGSDLLVYFEPTFIAQQAIRSNLYKLPLHNCYYKPFFQE